MNKTLLARLIPVVCAGLACGEAAAAGFQLLEQNASGIGNAYAGSAAVAENASTIFYNPAGMTRLAAREYSVGLSLVRPTFKFNDRGSSVGALAGSGNGNDAGDWGFVPNGYLSWQLSKDLYAGIGLGAPFGLMTEYERPWLGGAQAVKFEIKTYNVNPSLAYRVNEKLSIGGGVSYQRMEAEYSRLATVTSAALAATTATLSASDWSWGWNVGALFAPSPAMRIGVSYRSKVKHELTGDLAVAGPAAGATAALTTGAARAEVELPDVAILSVAQQLDDKWEMLGDVSWTGWSSIPHVDIVRTSGALSGTAVQRLDSAFRDTWRFAFGTNYRWNDAWKLKFGVAWDQTPVRDPQHRLVSLPDNNRTWITAGAQWKPTKAGALDVGLAYLFVPESSIDNDQSAQGRGRVTGVYDSRAWILGAQYSAAF